MKPLSKYRKGGQTSHDLHFSRKKQIAQVRISRPSLPGLVRISSLEMTMPQEVCRFVGLRGYIYLASRFSLLLHPALNVRYGNERKYDVVMEYLEASISRYLPT